MIPLSYSLSIDMDCEVAGVELIHHNLILVTIYRSPKGDMKAFFEILEKLLSYIYRLNKQSIICGDFNVNFLSCDKNQEYLINLICPFGMKKTILEPTRGSKCLDNVFTSLNTEYTAIVVNNHVSDHFGQIFTFTVDDRQSYLTENKFKNLTKINEDTIRVFKYYLSKEMWNEVFLQNGVDGSFNSFLNTLKYYFDLSFSFNSDRKHSKSLRNKRPKVEWYNPDLKSMKDRLDLLV
uniref:Endonuclease/exonuclease/phosphatase domain-containing protein n=1 Tax=Cuerna arida TaxID=1464854 RepID=A0A1B6G4Q7_9HEMI